MLSSLWANVNIDDGDDLADSANGADPGMEVDDSAGPICVVPSRRGRRRVRGTVMGISTSLKIKAGMAKRKTTTLNENIATMAEALQRNTMPGCRALARTLS